MVPVLSVILLVIMEIIKTCLKHQLNHLVSFTLVVVFQTYSSLQLHLVLAFNHAILVTCSTEISFDGVVIIFSQSYIHH